MFLTSIPSVLGAFVPLAAYATSGQHGYAARVQQEPVNATVLELTNLDPFEDMNKRFSVPSPLTELRLTSAGSLLHVPPAASPLGISVTSISAQTLAAVLLMQTMHTVFP